MGFFLGAPGPGFPRWKPSFSGRNSGAGGLLLRMAMQLSTPSPQTHSLLLARRWAWAALLVSSLLATQARRAQAQKRPPPTDSARMVPVGLVGYLRGDIWASQPPLDENRPSAAVTPNAELGLMLNFPSAVDPGWGVRYSRRGANLEDPAVNYRRSYLGFPLYASWAFTKGVRLTMGLQPDLSIQSSFNPIENAQDIEQDKLPQGNWQLSPFLELSVPLSPVADLVGSFRTETLGESPQPFYGLGVSFNLTQLGRPDEQEKQKRQQARQTAQRASEGRLLMLLPQHKLRFEALRELGDVEKARAQAQLIPLLHERIREKADSVLAPMALRFLPAEAFKTMPPGEKKAFLEKFDMILSLQTEVEAVAASDLSDTKSPPFVTGFILITQKSEGQSYGARFAVKGLRILNPKTRAPFANRYIPEAIRLSGLRGAFEKAPLAYLFQKLREEVFVELKFKRPSSQKDYEGMGRWLLYPGGSFEAP